MGEFNVTRISDEADLQKFRREHLNDIRAFEMMLDRGMFTSGPTHIGAEQELCLVDKFYKPAPVGEALLKELNDEHFTTEIGRFNLEINLDPFEFQGDCLARTEGQLQELMAKLNAVAAKHGVGTVLTGILPTIRRLDLNKESIVQIPRYIALVEALEEARGPDYEFKIVGIDELMIKQGSGMLESSNTSFQVHLQVAPEEFVDQYNISQAVLAPVLATACNSPLLFGKRLWRETRVALFAQSLDTRKTSEHLRHSTARVFFGDKWLQGSVVNLYKEELSRYRPLLMANFEEPEDAVAEVEAGRTPPLTSLRVHSGTVYRWNRQCYGISPDGKPHLRIENRALPAGPSIKDEMANTAFWLGLMKGLGDVYPDITKVMLHEEARSNFTMVARSGMDTKLNWVNDQKFGTAELIEKELIPIAKQGLKKSGINPKDIDGYLDVIRERNEKRSTGAQWLIDSHTALTKSGATNDMISTALTAATQKYQSDNTPVHNWPLASTDDVSNWEPLKLLVEEFMTRDLFTVSADEIPEVVAEIMDFNRIRHTPVENNQGELIGLVSSRHLLRYFSGLAKSSSNNGKTVQDIMVTEPITIAPDGTVSEAINLFQEKRVSCLPVVEGKKLVGVITEEDFLSIARRLMKEID